MNNTATTSAGKMEDDTVEDDDENNNNNNNDANKGWYYPCDWTLKTRATFAKICSLRDDDTNDEAEEDFDEYDDFDTDEEKRKIQQTFLSSSSVSKSFSWVNDERGAKRRRRARTMLFPRTASTAPNLYRVKLFLLLLFTVLFEFNPIQRK